MRWLHRLYLRMRISAAKRDVKYFEREQRLALHPDHAEYFEALAASTRKTIQAWRVELMLLED